jgi:hypothetical protein
MLKIPLGQSSMVRQTPQIAATALRSRSLVSGMIAQPLDFSPKFSRRPFLETE